MTIQSDEGTEFVNATVANYLKRQEFNVHTTQIPK